ncbi:MAG: hypothetical protein P8J45_05760 [Phycisphaerales bacterium]|nr:hypothetical protein [Phycisphaerales bacterium]
MFDCTLLALALASTNGANADLRGQDIFPKSTFLVAQAQNFEGVLDRFGNSRMWKLMGEGESLKDWMNSLTEGMAREYDLDQSKVGLPEYMGLSAYVSFNEDLGIEVPAYMIYVDFGDHTDMAKAVYDGRMNEMTADAATRFDKEEMRGRDMLVFESNFEMPQLDEFADDAGMMLPVGGDMDFVNDSLSSIYMIRDEARILIGSEPIALDDALSIIDGGKVKVLADNDEYQALMDMIPEGSRDMNAMILTKEIQPMIAPVIAGPMAAGVMPIVLELFGDIQGYGFWGDVATGSNMMELGVGMLMDGERRGLMKLIDVSRPVAEVPAFVPASALSYGRIDFDFKNLVPTIREIIASLPEGDAQQIEPMFEQFAPMIGAGFSTLGPEIHVFTVETDSPFTPTRTTISIPTSDAESLEQVFAMMAPAAGLMPRDFNGETIYSDPLDEFSQMAVGIGAGNLVIGQSEGVEAVLRSMGQKDLPKMESTPSVRSVTRSLPSGELMGWGVLDSKQLATQQIMAALMPVMLEMTEEVAGIEDQMDQIMKMDAKDIADVLGPGWWYMKRTDSGMIFRGGVLEAGN